MQTPRAEGFEVNIAVRCTGLFLLSEPCPGLLADWADVPASVPFHSSRLFIRTRTSRAFAFVWEEKYIRKMLSLLPDSGPKPWNHLPAP